MSGEIGHVLFSHGFATDSESRGLFKTTGEELEEFGFIIHKFNYNGLDDDGNFVVRPFSKQQEKIEYKIANIPTGKPLIVVAHSEGNTAASRAKNIARADTFVSAVPPTEDSRKLFHTKLLGNHAESRGDGSWALPTSYPGKKLIVPKEYMDEQNSVDEMADYQSVADVTKLTIIRAMEDEFYDPIDVSRLRNMKHIDFLHANHNFTGSSRKAFARIVATIALRTAEEYAI